MPEKTSKGSTLFLGNVCPRDPNEETVEYITFYPHLIVRVHFPLSRFLYCIHDYYGLHLGHLMFNASLVYLIVPTFVRPLLG
jgi:hypothetical protein